MPAVQPSTIHELYRRQAAQRGNSPAVQGLNAADLTFNGFIDQLQRVTDALNGWGIGRGDRVLIQLPNGPEYFVVMHGVSTAAVAVLADPRLSADEVDSLLRFTEPRAIIVQQGAESAGRAVAQAHGLRVVEIVPTPEVGAGSLIFAAPPPASSALPVLNGPDDLSFLIMTSGTTALPRLVPKTQRAMLKHILLPLETQYRALHETVPLRTLNYLPMHLAFGAWVTSAALASGGVAACMPGLDPNQFFHWLDVYRPSFLAGPPPVLEQFLALASHYPDVLAHHSVRYINTSSVRLPEATRAELYRVFGAPIVQTYAMTELGTVARLVLLPGSVDPVTSIGRAEEPENIRIVDSSGAPLSAGQVGEIVVRTDVFPGYWNNPEANRDAFTGEWFRTGDEGYKNDDGALFVVGRVKEVINSGGAKVSPYEVEAVLRQHSQVVDVAVFGIRHAETGEAVAAAVVGNVTERELRKFASERLPFYKVPMRIVLVDAIPQTASGKVPRNRLAELLGLH